MGGNADIVVAGAGAIGSTIALTLARAGHRVTVVDPAPDANASAVAAGMLAPAFETLFDATSAGQFWLLREARDLWPALAASIGVELDQTGALALGTPDEVERWTARLGAIEARAEVLSIAEATAATRWLSQGRAAVRTPEDWRLEPRATLAALRQAAEAAGAGFRDGRVVGFADGRVELEAGELVADRLVVATGAARDLAELAPALTALTPIKGHILRAAGEPATGAVIRGEGVYLCPTVEGWVLGASMEKGRGDSEIDPAVVADLIERAARISPGLADVDWRPETGVRAATRDGLPLVGETGPGVFVAVGARRNGWLLAPLIANVVADAVAGRARSATAMLFDPARGPLSPG
jgi:glycine oxidase